MIVDTQQQRPNLNVESALDALLSRHTDADRDLARRGIERVAEQWRAEDGDEQAFVEFCTENFVADQSERQRLLDRFESGMGWVSGHLYEMRRHLRRWSDLRGDEFPGIDDVFAKFDPAPDLSEQFFRQKIAFIALLNFDRPPLRTMLNEGGSWDVDKWAEVRISRAFDPRIPGHVNDMARELGHRANMFVAEFHIPVGQLEDERGQTWLDADRKLLAHWLVREEVRAGYNEPDGIYRQRALMWVMRRHIDGTIPVSVMNGPNDKRWNAAKNTLDGEPATDVLGPERYERWLDMRTVATEFDKYYVEHPTAMARKFELHREIPEDDVERLLVDLLSSPVRSELSAFMRKRLGRDLEPQDVYFDEIVEGEPADRMNAAVREKFGDEKGFEKALPGILRDLGFSPEDAEFLGSRIRVEIAKGAGHAMRPGRPEYDAWLRTNRLPNELGWDGFDTAMHELGHNLEQLCSTHFVPRPALRGVPNTACTEAFAFLYQSLAKRVLGLEEKNEGSTDAPDGFGIDSMQSMLAACQIAGPSLVELYTWRWLYENPDADAETMRDRVIAIAGEVWDRFYQEHFGDDPYATLAAYQHMIAYPLYLADYALGHIISHQIRSYIRGRDLAAETKRICSLGRLSPDLWMQRAVGRGISVEPLAEDAAAAVRRMV
ncbi:MAG: hypothetical protein ACOC0P_00655 [Planctomycetota bacterium]